MYVLPCFRPLQESLSVSAVHDPLAPSPLEKLRFLPGNPTNPSMDYAYCPSRQQPAISDPLPLHPFRSVRRESMGREAIFSFFLVLL